MTTSSSRLAYMDCFDLFDRAIANVKGVRIKFAEKEDAWRFRLRLHTARRIDRQDNMMTYADDHPMYGRSPYDVITARIKEADGHIWLYLEKLDIADLEIEELSDEEPTQPEAPLMQQMTDTILALRPKETKRRV